MLKGQKVLLRPLKKEDWHKTIIWRNDPELTGLVMSHPFPITEEMEKEWYDNELTNKTNRAIYFAIEDTKSNNQIGIIFLNNINWISGTVQFGLLIGENSARGKGLGKDVLEIIIDYAFSSLNLRKISLEVISINLTAIKLYEKMGFKVEGLLKKHWFFKNQYHDVLIMSKFKE
jgi:UDP-4-amino-4,6-dideoxy-N-acetyl-beta-L-altrosamine N-acetyltransferase